MSKYDHLDRDALVRLLDRRDAEKQLGLVWERDELDPDTALNDDFVALDLDESLRCAALRCAALRCAALRCAAQ